MYTNNVNEAFSPVRWALKNIGVHKYADEETRRYWRKVYKRNGGRKIKTLRSHRTGKKG